MNWDDLKLFLVVSRQQKLDLAAALLQQDPTTLSRRLRRNLTKTLTLLLTKKQRLWMLKSSR